MDKDTYVQMTGFFKTRPRAAFALSAANTAITDAIYIAYPCLIAALFIGEGWLGALGTLISGNEVAWPTGGYLLRALLVPFISFSLVTLVRRALNAPRPYEVFDTEPVVPKSTTGSSFPSRHAFSIFVIGMTFVAACPIAWAGPVILCLGVALAALRVLMGVHYPRDVVAGALCGIAAGLIGFWTF